MLGMRSGFFGLVAGVCLVRWWVATSVALGVGVLVGLTAAAWTARIRVELRPHDLIVRNLFRLHHVGVADVASITLLQFRWPTCLALRLQDGKRVELMALPLDECEPVVGFLIAMRERSIEVDFHW